MDQQFKIIYWVFSGFRKSLNILRSSKGHRGQMLHHMDPRIGASVYYINWLSGLHIHPSKNSKVYQFLSSDRWCLPHMLESKILSGHEALDGFVTPGWITETAPPALLWTAAWARLVAFHLRGRGGMGWISTARPNADTCCKLRAVCALRPACTSLPHSCSPCVALSMVCCGWRWWASSQPCRADVPRKLTFRTFINQPGFQTLAINVVTI